MESAELEWKADILPDFEARSILGGTLVRPQFQITQPRYAVVHVHGYNDYFFQRHLAQAFTATGNAFYAVDLDRAGRSLKGSDIPHYMADAAEQCVGIAAAVGAVQRTHPGVPVVVHAHSTGGLTAAIWAHDHRPNIAGLILNSPLFGFPSTHGGPLKRAVAHALLKGRPLTVVRHAPSAYATRLAQQWEFDTSLKRPHGVPVRAGWLAAVTQAQRRIRKGLSITFPVLVAHSDSCGPDREDNPLADVQDTVVDTRAIAALAPRLGPQVSTVVIPHGVHDLSLSAPDVRQTYFDAVIGWLDSLAS